MGRGVWLYSRRRRLYFVISRAWDTILSWRALSLRIMKVVSRAPPSAAVTFIIHRIIIRGRLCYHLWIGHARKVSAAWLPAELLLWCCRSHHGGEALTGSDCTVTVPAGRVKLHAEPPFGMHM